MDVEVVAKVPHVYGGAKRAVNERYLAEEKFLPFLKHMGWAEPAVAAAPLPPKSRTLPKLKRSRR